MRGFLAIGATVKTSNVLAMQAAYQAGRAAVLHAFANGLLATQRLSEAEVLAFFKTVRGVLEEEVTNTKRIQTVLQEAGIEESVSSQVVDAFREAIELQLRLIETEIPKFPAGTADQAEPARGTTFAVRVSRPDEHPEIRDRLNNAIAQAAIHRNCTMPRIGSGHAGYTGGIFSLLQNPARSVSEGTHVLSIDNNDQTAKWSKALFRRLGIPKCAVIPWNALGAYEDPLTGTAIKKNVPLCQQLIDTAKPVALVAQGRWAQRMADRLSFSGRIFRVPHPSRLGRASSSTASADIEAAFAAALKLMQTERKGTGSAPQ